MPERKNNDLSFNRAIGQAVAAVRAERGLTQQSVADQADLHYTYVSAIENGRYNPTWMNLRKVAVGLDIKPSLLIGRAEQIERRER